jgi:4-carboxymuconolactone decarboxylase
VSSSKPRIGRLPREEWTDEARAVFSYWGEPGAWENGSRTNTMMTLARHPQLGMAYNVFGRQVLLNSTLPVRVRELVVLRTAWHLKSEYEWHYHVGYAIAAGMTMDEIGAVREGPEAAVWRGQDDDRVVLQSVDDLLKSATISDATWERLTAIFDKQQLMDLVFMIGHYVMFGWAITALGIPLEDNIDRIGFDLKTASGLAPGARLRPGDSDGWTQSTGPAAVAETRGGKIE